VKLERRVVLVNPPSPAGLTANREGAGGLGYLDHAPAGFAYPPQTIAQVAAVLRQEGWQVRSLDAVAEGWAVAEATTRMLQAWPGEEAVCGVFVSSDTLQADLAFLAALRQEKTATPILAFGPATRYIQEELKQAGIARRCGAFLWRGGAGAIAARRGGYARPLASFFGAGRLCRRRLATESRQSAASGVGAVAGIALSLPDGVEQSRLRRLLPVLPLCGGAGQPFSRAHAGERR
jgi:hypothetical protein